MQELTNKLQRYLNQRFMLDSDQVKNYGDEDEEEEDDDGDDYVQVKEQQETLATVAGKTESTVERCERLEIYISCEDLNSYIIS